MIEGYFQDYRLIDESIIHELFAPSQTLVSELKAKYPVLNKTNTCSIVVRRGDYVNLPPMWFPVEDMAFYRKCMNKLQRTTRNDDIHYICISDDPDWCREQFIGERFIIIEDEPPLIDLYIALLSKHNIISNSSFAVWGALLNTNPDKHVYYSSPWLGVGMCRYDNSHKGIPPIWYRVHHLSEAYKYGVWLWLQGGIEKKNKKTIFEII